MLVLRSSFVTTKGFTRNLSAWQTYWASRPNSCSLIKLWQHLALHRIRLPDRTRCPASLPEQKGLWWVPWPGRNELRNTSHEQYKIVNKFNKPKTRADIKLVIKQSRNSRTRGKCKNKPAVFFSLNCFQLSKSVCLDSYDGDVYWRQSTKLDFPCILHISLAKTACTQFKLW